ncbi:helix-turn-helix domain-containing protein [Tardiphaga sp. 841_E9_N1_2]
MRPITSSSRSPGAIAAALGYSFQTAFAPAFRKLTGETPTDWRRRVV